MQEEVTQKTIALSVKTARVTADVLKNMLRKYLSGQKQKGKNPYKVGKQSYKELKSQGSGLSNIEITDGNIKSFERVAKKYRLDFALKKDSSTKPPTYYVFFKGQDTEMMNLAFKKYLGVQMNKKDKPLAVMAGVRSPMTKAESNRNHCLKWSKAVWRQTVLPISRESIRYLWLECSLWRAD